MSDIRNKALRYLRDGLVTMRSVTTHPGERRACAVDAQVSGARGVHKVRYDVSAGRWSCSCGRNGGPFQPCPHVAAVQMVTGHPSVALRVTPEEEAIGASS